MDDCYFTSFGAYCMGLLVNSDTRARYNWSSCYNGWSCSTLGILLRNALVEDTMAKLNLPHQDASAITANSLLYHVLEQLCTGAVAVLLLLAVGLLCAYELCAVYVTAGAKASQRYSPSGFFFGVSAIALAINMLFICRMVFNGNGVDIDEYVRRAYKFAYSDCIEGFTPWTSLFWFPLGSACIFNLVWPDSQRITLAWSNYISCNWNVGTCLYGFKLLKSRVAALFIAGTSRVFLICFGVHYWFLGHCISYAVGICPTWSCRFSSLITNPSAARRDALESTVIRLREGFRKKEQNCSSSSSEGCGSSVKRSSSADAGHLGNGTGPSTVVQETEVGPSYVDKNFDHNSSLVACSSSGMESQGCESSASNSVSQALDLNLALAFQEKLSDPRISSMLKRRARQGELELTNLLQDKGLDPNFAVMLKENGLDPMILHCCKEVVWMQIEITVTILT
ncbi:UNVERIFIED_CONTAM: Calpain-type cysteine protease DEK1 [Sesamum radiatum]|uniref:Calpain-type cysteine protease DEK1 n=1 Tax=Sesamum radiatum TaxID=300843 RepID=A0AAW2W7J8_SESRA